MIDVLKSHLKNKEAAKIISIIEDNPAVLDERDENGTSVFLMLLYSGLETVFNIAKDLKLSFSFHEAIVSGKINEVRNSLDRDKSLANQYSSDGFTPLSLAAFFGQTEIAKLLLENGADPNLHATNPSKVNALHSAAAKENYALCELFIKRGVNVNATQAQNVTALHAAAHKGNLKLVQLFVENGADINHKMDNGETAMNMAKKDGHQEVLDYLHSLKK